MEYETITGSNGKSILYYFNSHLYVRKSSSRDGNILYLECYEASLSKNKDNNGNFKVCGARLQIDQSTKLCEANGTCHKHENHEVKFRDLVSLNAMKEKCRYLAEHFPFSSRKIPVKEIFLLEMAK